MTKTDNKLSLNSNLPSIKQLDIRCHSEKIDWDWPSDEDDPFIATLKDLASDIPDQILGAFEPDVEDRISFRCCEGERESEIRAEFEEHPDWAQHVIDGEIPHEVAKQYIERGDSHLVLKALLENMTEAERQKITDELLSFMTNGGEDELEN